MSRQHWSDLRSQGMPFQGDSDRYSETHWNDTIPYTNELEAPKKHAICLRLNLERNNPKKDGIAYR
ncbi:hypothetical protein ICN17_09090 [Polynucleobacter sp. 73C-SIWE]|uniref:hypothetical protein n=1 Tax=Polynucleobacter sp. 73C-SIWE TaxID=2689098 RepID=UPI0011AB8211|nr:hypothetical protein [Polynucleobacter sp. 73C-SIWE]MBU3580153.1 hypothetical protein [Polynucleobacter sp. 73C-SIWE]